MRLIVVSDIHSMPNDEGCLSPSLTQFDRIDRLTLSALCGRPDLAGERLLKHLYQDGGMDAAVTALIAMTDENCIGLGYSAGGVALWRAVRKGLAISGLFCISSARLRNEASLDVPNCVFFAESDQNKPSTSWLEAVPQMHYVFERVGHSYYCDRHSGASRATVEIIQREILRWRR